MKTRRSLGIILISAALILIVCITFFFKKKAEPYPFRFALAEIELETGISMAQSSLMLIDLAGPAQLDEKAGRPTTLREQLTTGRKGLMDRMRDLNPPPADHRDAFARLRDLYAIYEQYAKAALAKDPKPLSKLENEMLTVQIARIKTDLQVIRPR